MTEYQKMQAGETYNFTDAEIAGHIMRANRLMRRLNSDAGLTDEEQEQLMRQLVPGADPTAHINLPFYCDHGDQIRLGAHTFINYGCTMLD
ncbi:MAG: sugar O-acetyltransferase, partial [Paludibacteraceae bacterium]|nr:sugar O-acetyltransferase [Paludibacteraceae bacterium]